MVTHVYLNHLYEMLSKSNDNDHDSAQISFPCVPDLSDTKNGMCQCTDNEMDPIPAMSVVLVHLEYCMHQYVQNSREVFWPWHSDDNR